MLMKITAIRIRLCHGRDEKLKAFVSVTFDDCFAIRGVKIIQGTQHRKFVAMPSRSLPDGRNQDICHPINKETRAWMEREIISAYEEEMNRNSEDWVGDVEDSRGPDTMSGGPAAAH